MQSYALNTVLLIKTNISQIISFVSLSVCKMFKNFTFQHYVKTFRGVLAYTMSGHPGVGRVEKS